MLNVIQDLYSKRLHTHSEISNLYLSLAKMDVCWNQSVKRLFFQTYLKILFNIQIISPTNLTHLQLEESPLLLHLFSDFRPADFCPDHPVLPRVLLLLLLYLGAGRK